MTGPKAPDLRSLASAASESMTAAPFPSGGQRQQQEWNQPIDE